MNVAVNSREIPESRNAIIEVSVSYHWIQQSEQRQSAIFTLMLRSLSRRLRALAAFPVLWTVLAAAEFPGVHACAVHSSVAASHAHDHSHSSSGETKKTQCTCPGAACCPSLELLTRQEYRAAPAIAHSPEPIAHQPQVWPSRPLDLRPLFPIGPPASPHSAHIATG